MTARSAKVVRFHGAKQASAVECAVTRRRSASSQKTFRAWRLSGESLRKAGVEAVEWKRGKAVRDWFGGWWPARRYAERLRHDTRGFPAWARPSGTREWGLASGREEIEAAQCDGFTATAGDGHVSVAFSGMRGRNAWCVRRRKRRQDRRAARRCQLRRQGVFKSAPAADGQKRFPCLTAPPPNQGCAEFSEDTKARVRPHSSKHRLSASCRHGGPPLVNHGDPSAGSPFRAQKI